MSELSLEENNSVTEMQGIFEAPKKSSSSSLFNRCLTIFKKGILHLIYITLLFGLAFYVKTETNMMKQLSRLSMEREADILNALSDLNAKVEKLSDDHDQIVALKTELNQVEHTMLTEQSLSGLAKSAELKNVILQLQQLARQISFAPIHPVARDFSRQSSGKIHLPFQVLSIDSMAGQAYASVQYHQDTLPLRLNESVAGWKVVRLDSLAGLAVWENAQRRRITTSMMERHYA